MQDPDGGVPFFWGVDSEGHLVVSDDVETVKKGCGKSFASFPKGILDACNNLLPFVPFRFTFVSFPSFCVVIELCPEYIQWFLITLVKNIGPSLVY